MNRINLVEIRREAKAVLRPWWHRIRPRVQLTLGLTEQRDRIERLEAEVVRLQARLIEVDVVLQYADTRLPSSAGTKSLPAAGPADVPAAHRQVPR